MSSIKHIKHKRGNKKAITKGSKLKEGERNFSCLNYSKCLTEAAINNISLNCAGCDKANDQSFNDLLKHENTSHSFDISTLKQNSCYKKK